MNAKDVEIAAVKAATKFFISCGNHDPVEVYKWLDHMCDVDNLGKFTTDILLRSNIRMTGVHAFEKFEDWYAIDIVNSIDELTTNILRELK